MIETYKVIGEEDGVEHELVPVKIAVNTLPWGKRHITRLANMDKLIAIKIDRIWFVQKHLSEDVRKRVDLV